MLDTWSDSNQRNDFDQPADSKRGPAFRSLIERALQRELTRRRQLRPHAQLSIAPDAPVAVVEEAYARLRVRYDPGAFAEYGDAAVATATSIAELMRQACEQMCRPASEAGAPQQELPRLETQPRPDETLRALDTLRGAIARRLAEAAQHQREGRARDAIRVFESVLYLERRNETALRALATLREQLAPSPPPSRWRRLIDRLFGHKAPVESVR
ncbi:MAG: hypothetical protein JWM53_6254 [bacterium]|nr:hypothetical protein [bacterium]